ncbi:MAG: hypothetical protein GX769_01715 [Erysipelothrix sp.]|nr:hypothetical protein [Erysipelothrix sp.]
MKDISKFFIENNVSKLVEDVLMSQELTFEQIEQIIKDKKYPFESKDLENIIDRILMAKAKGEKVVIVGDYDADGIMATTILVKALKAFGVETGFYIPDRLKEGYGINKAIVSMVSEKGYSLIITVDNGVVAYEALDFAKSLGIDVIVTDHHTIDKAVNYNYDYILHPDYLSVGYNDLAGAGIALLIAEKLLNGQTMAEYYVYAMVATIADMVSVFGHNRNIIKNGLYVLNKHGNQHIEKLIHYRNGIIDQQVISFQVVPKLNTAGRLADRVNVNNLVRYFLLEDSTEIEALAKTITSLNQDRITMTRDSFNNSNGIVKYGSLNIVIDPEIHEGLTGLIAGRHMNKLNEPVLVLTKNNNLYKGSGRSPKGYDIFALISPLRDLLESFGGHKQACGLSIDENDLDIFLDAITEDSKDLKVLENIDPFLKLDLDSLNLEVYNQFQSLEPYGVDFIKPLLKVKVKTVQNPSILAEKFLKWNIRSGIEMISFDRNLDLEMYKNIKEIEAFVDLSLNEFRGRKTINLIIQEFI